MFSKILPLIDGITIEDPKADLKVSDRIGKYRIGQKAIFFPLNINWAYLPLSEVRECFFERMDYNAKLCCGGATLKDAVPTVELLYAKDGKSPIEFTSDRQAEKFANLLKERLAALRG